MLIQNNFKVGSCKYHSWLSRHYDLILKRRFRGEKLQQYLYRTLFVQYKTLKTIFYYFLNSLH